MPDTTHSSIDALIEVGRAIGLPQAFSWWCRQQGIDDLTTFLHVEIPARNGGSERLWVALQGTLRVARRKLDTGREAEAVALVESLLNRPEFSHGAQPAQLRARAVAMVLQVREPEPDEIPSARGELLRSGGVASARHVADRLARRTGQAVSVRSIRDRFRNTHGAVRKIGAGYYAVREHPVISVQQWVEERLTTARTERLPSLVEAILARYPHGHRPAVEAWLHQEPGKIRVRGDIVFLSTQVSGHR